MVFQKIIFQNRYVALETPSRPPSPPLHGKYHLKFPFWLSAPVPYQLLCWFNINLSFNIIINIMVRRTVLFWSCISPGARISTEHLWLKVWVVNRNQHLSLLLFTHFAYEEGFPLVWHFFLILSPPPSSSSSLPAYEYTPWLMNCLSRFSRITFEQQETGQN